ncbi:polysaccharide biosynthesis protein [Enhygromyxa salina]|uniref:Polysaccharide biosynthesis protein n=1 Tax=Enhygromyxa salina TaxID=215803 RepID=A0A0C2D1D2_9BACT|nr:polysaccharide biosynthesis C-terminal domain-containing protein [Enhygromyxa salina]KIG17041.1 polysaccharide biosynthesis protein [Enhygromyxa salina]
MNDTNDVNEADPALPKLGSSRARIARLFKNSGIYALGELGLSLLSVVMMPILTMFLLPAEYGVFSLAMMAFTGFTHLCNPALHGSVTRFYFDHEHDEAAKARFQGTILSFLLAWSFGMCVIATVTGPALFPLLFVDLPFWPYGLMTVWMVFLGVLGVVPKAVWVASENSKPFVGVSLLGSAVNVLGTLSLVGLAGIGVMGMFVGRAASLLVLAVPFTVFTVRHLKLAWSWDDLRSALRFSLPLVPHLIAHWVLGMSDRFVIVHYYAGLDVKATAAAVAELGITPNAEGELNLGTGAVGIYTAAYDFMSAVNMIAVSMNNAWVPQFTRAHGRPEQRAFVARSITYFMLAVGSMSAAMVVLSPTIVRTGLINAKFAFAAELAPILALGGLFQGLYYVYVAVLFYYKQNRLIPVITVVSGVTNVALNLLWLPKYGLVGAAWATVVGYTILVVGVRWAARRCEMPDFEVGRLARIAGVLLAVVAAGMLVDGRLGVWLELLAKLGVLGVGALALWGMGVLARREPQ